MEQNKITTWWKKVLLIVGVYTVYWLVFYGVVLPISGSYIEKSSDFINFIFVLYIFCIVPILSFIIPYKLSKKINIRSSTLYIINVVYVLFSAYIFFIISTMMYFKIK